MQHHHIKPDEAQLVQVDLGSRPSYHIYRPDGLWAKLERTFQTREAAQAYINDRGWKAI